MRNRKRITFWIIMGLVILYFASWGVVRWGEGWIFEYYLKDYNLPDTTVQQPFKLVTVVNPDQDTLRGALYGPDDPAAVVILFRGSGGQPDWYEYDESIFKEPRWSILLSDYRGGGWSKGSYKSEGDFFEDAMVWYQYLLGQFPDRPIIIYGISLGSPTAAWLARETQSPLLILQSAFYSWENQMAHIFFWMPYRWITRFELSTGKYVKGFQGHTLVFQGENDTSTPLKEAENLVLIHPDRSDLVIIKGKGHETFHDDLVFKSTMNTWIQKINQHEIQ